jgi:hypothetical protein
MKKTALLFVSAILLSSCSPKITTSISKQYATLDYQEEVRVFNLDESVPYDFEELGIVKIGDTGFSTNCGWEVVIERAKSEARKVGGNALKITEHILPTMMGSSCHRITAQILRIENFDSTLPVSTVDSTLLNKDYALIHFYRYSGVGALVSYDIHLGDTVLCRASNNWKKTVKVRKEGYNTVWAKTETKIEIPVNIKMGQEYYIRCGISMGVMVGHPVLTLVDNNSGRLEYQSIKYKKPENSDAILMKDGRTIECTIISEDENSIYITLVKDGKETKTQVSKSQVSSIQKGE